MLKYWVIMILAAGFFDGVHRGHQAVLATARAAARAGEKVYALTFDKHPRSVVDPAGAPPLITTFEERLKLLDASGLDGCRVLTFDAALAAETPEEFVASLLKDAAEPLSAIVCGENWRFGKNAAGTPPTLSALGKKFGFSVSVVSAEQFGGAPISSTRIRKAVSAVRFDDAAEMLGRRWLLCGKVVRGNGIGRTLGFPTANLEPGEGVLLPPEGVYAAKALGHTAVVNFGAKPTFRDATTTIEVHIADFAADIYGSELEIDFVELLRMPRTFSSPAALAEQIALDLAAARAKC